MRNWRKATRRRRFGVVRPYVRSLGVLYRNHRGQQVAETVEFDAAGQVIRSVACYSA